jgi:perosamine synthetase
MDNSICKINVELGTVLEAINAAPAGIAFLVNEQNVLKGVCTDGDFRRILLSGRSLTDIYSDEDIKPCIVASQEEDIQTLIDKTDRKVRIIPIINEIGEPVDYFRYEHKVNYTPVAEPSLSSKELEYLTDAFLSTWISSRGKYIDRFEAEFSAFSDCKHGVAVSNGTVAIHLALVALGVGEGDEVIVPDLTFAATINAVIHANATPVIVDVDRERWTIDPEAIQKAITPKTKCIIPVHIYGQPCDMDPIMEIARANNLSVIEDAAEAHGAMYKGKKVGSFGDVATFSFFGNKIITTGEGGMCVTNSEELDKKMRILRDHGMNPKRKYFHETVGYNYRLTNLQAAIGCAQLERIEQIIEEHKQIENNYLGVLNTAQNFIWQKNFPNSEKVVWLVSCLIKEGRDELIKYCGKNNVDVRPFFYPLSTMPIYKVYARKICTNALLISEQGVNLPTVSTVSTEVLDLLRKYDHR